MDESTIDLLLAIRRKAFSDNPEIDIDRALFASLLKNQNAAVATMKANGHLTGYVVATPIMESWVKDDVQEIKDIMKPHVSNALHGKISAAIEGGACYYPDDLAVAKQGLPEAKDGRSPLSQLDERSERFHQAVEMVRDFFSQLDHHSARYLVLHGRMVNGAYKGYTKRIERNGYRKIHENVHPDWFGGEDFMLMVFEKD
jgi:hypothetical protein